MQALDDESYMKLALQEARRAYDAEEVPVGAIIVINSTIIGRGFNQVEQLTDATAHAEIIALTAAFNQTGGKYLPEATIYITVEPCLMCAGALYWSKIGRIVYGASDPKNGYGKFCTTRIQPFHPHTTLSHGVLQESCAELMKAFFRARR